MLDHLRRRDILLSLSEEKEYWDVKIENDALDSWAEMMLKVVPLEDSEPKRFWHNNLTNIHHLLRRHERVKYDYKKLEVEYKSLLKRYSSLVDVVEKLKKDF